MTYGYFYIGRFRQHVGLVVGIVVRPKILRGEQRLVANISHVVKNEPDFKADRISTASSSSYPNMRHIAS